MKVKDIMTKNPVTVSPDSEVIQVARILIDNRFNGLPVIDNTGKLVGIVCQSDLISQQKKLPIPSFFTLLDGFIPLTSMKALEKEVNMVAAKIVSEIMTSDPVTVDTETDIETVADLMVVQKYHTLPVIENGKLIGVVGKEDVLKTLIAKREDKEEA